jgi:hypothetical protein
MPEMAAAAPCPADPNRSPDVWFVRDQTTHQDLTDAQIARPLPLLHAYEVSLDPGMSSGAASINDLLLTPPAGVAFKRDGHSVILAPDTAGPLTTTASWTESNGVDPDCTRTSSLTLTIAALTQRPQVHITKHVYSDRPMVSFTVRVARSAFGMAAAIAIRAKVTRHASPPSGPARALFTLPLGLPPFGAQAPSSGLLAHRSVRVTGIGVSGVSAFDPLNTEQIPVPTGGTGAQVTLTFDGTGRKLHNRFGSFYRNGVLSRRGLAVQVVQDGTVIGQLRTGIICVNVPNHGAPRCHLPGYTTTG